MELRHQILICDTAVRRQDSKTHKMSLDRWTTADILGICIVSEQLHSFRRFIWTLHPCRLFSGVNTLTTHSQPNLQGGLSVLTLAAFRAMA